MLKTDFSVIMFEYVFPTVENFNAHQMCIRTQPNIYDGSFFWKQLTTKSHYFRKNLYLSCSTGF